LSLIIQERDMPEWNAPQHPPRTEGTPTAASQGGAQSKTAFEGVAPEGERRGADSRPVVSELLKLLLAKGEISPEASLAALDHAARRLGETLGADAVVILMLDPDGVHARFQNVYLSPRAGDGQAAKRKAAQQRVAKLQSAAPCPGRCCLWEPLTRGESVMVGGEARDHPFQRQVCDILGFPMDSVIAVPLRVNDVTIGSVEALNKRANGKPAEFTRGDLKLAEQMTRCATLVLRRALYPDSGPSEREVAVSLARAANLSAVALDGQYDPDYVLLHHLGEEKLRRFSLLPLARVGPNDVRVAVINPLDSEALRDFEVATGLRVMERLVTTPGEIQRALDRAFQRVGADPEVTAGLMDGLDVSGVLQEELAFAEEEADERSAPIIQLANRIVEDAFNRRASDVHVEPQASECVVRYRVDGICVPKLKLRRHIHAPLISRFKIMSNLDITERRLPQDGRINFQRFNPKYPLDLRVSVIPSSHGEGLVLRLLDKRGAMLPLEKLGFSEHNLETYRRVIKIPYGMVLHCGPTGSGKTTTLYAALHAISSPELKIITAEDPIEYGMAGVTQVQIHREIGLTFAACLRSFLRHDPDIILVGEIRDRETADTALQAAQTGHLLFSTLHTNDASSTVIRLTEMGVEPFLISSSLLCVCAQRLMRRLCACKMEREPKEEERAMLARGAALDAPAKIAFPVGCRECDKVGYRGRIGIHELLEVNEDLREMISRGLPAEDLKTAARKNGMRTLFEDAMDKVKAGISSLPEALSVVALD
jgi:type IV pilus assembly protein PilB